MKIGRKLAIGYTVIVALIGGIVYTYLREWRQMVSLESEIKQIHEVRQSVHEAYVHMLDLTMFGETILEWEKADTAIYRAKRHKVDSILCEFKDYYSGERIDSLRVLMAEKEIQLFNISQLFEKQVELGEELADISPESFCPEDAAKLSTNEVRQLRALMVFACQIALHKYLPHTVLASQAINSMYSKLSETVSGFFSNISDGSSFTFYYLSVRKSKDVVENIGKNYAMLCDKDNDEFLAAVGGRIFSLVDVYVCDMIEKAEFAE